MKIDALTDLPLHLFLQPSGCRSCWCAGGQAVGGDSGQPREQHPQGLSPGLQGTGLACTFQVLVGFFSLCSPGCYHSFATAVCPTRQHVFFITLPSLAPAQCLPSPRWDEAAGRDDGGGGRTDTCSHAMPAEQTALLPRSCSPDPASRWPRGRAGGGPGWDNGPAELSTGPASRSSCPPIPLPKPLPLAARSTRPLT